MHFEKDYYYHIYNRSNETVFFEYENYIFFLRKIRKHIKPCCNIIAWCLMPNHFHLLVQATKESEKNIEEVHRPSTQQLSKNLGIVLASYTRAINKQHNRKGKLWSTETHAKLLYRNGGHYLDTCFAYIHSNPVSAGLVQNPIQWTFSSFSDYAGLRKGTLIKKDLAFEILNIHPKDFSQFVSKPINETDVKTIF